MRSVGVSLIVVGWLWTALAGSFLAFVTPWFLAGSWSEVPWYTLLGLLLGVFRFGWPGLVALIVGAIIVINSPVPLAKG